MKIEEHRNDLTSEMPNITVSTRGIQKLLEKLNPHKAAGPDMIKPIILKTLAIELSPTCTLTNNNLLFTRHHHNY
jgi:hypothetical protein